MAALAVLGIGFAIGAHMLSARAASQQSELDRLRNLTIAAQESKLHTEQRMRDPVNARVLDRAHFLNTMFLRKSFSWTAVMMDLENVLPIGVQVTSIEPQIAPDGNVVIRLRVAGERSRAVQLVRNLERSRRFLQPRRLQPSADGRALCRRSRRARASPPRARRASAACRWAFAGSQCAKRVPAIRVQAEAVQRKCCLADCLGSTRHHDSAGSLARSTAVVVPPPNSSSVLRRVPRLTARARQLLTAVNLHFAGVAALVILDLFLLAHLLLAWQAVTASNNDAIAQQQTMLTAARIADRPLQGIDEKLLDSTAQANNFYLHRLPYEYSQVLAELGAVTSRTGVRLSRVNYGQLPVLSGPYALTQVTMDASIAGDYRSVVGFINAIERDHVFFVINGITLTGQQTGQVNLRLRLTTYLRAANPDEQTTEAPVLEPETPSTTAAPSPGGQQ